MAKPRARSRSKKKGKGISPTQRKRRPQLPLEDLDWKNFPSLRRFVSERGKIRSRRITGLSRRQQSQIAKAVKRELPHWRVLYWDEGLDWFLARDPRHQDRARAEYEITLKDAFAPPR